MSWIGGINLDTWPELVLRGIKAPITPTNLMALKLWGEGDDNWNGEEEPIPTTWTEAEPWDVPNHEIPNVPKFLSRIAPENTPEAEWLVKQEQQTIENAGRVAYLLLNNPGYAELVKAFQEGKEMHVLYEKFKETHSWFLNPVTHGPHWDFLGVWAKYASEHPGYVTAEEAPKAPFHEEETKKVNVTESHPSEHDQLTKDLGEKAQTAGDTINGHRENLKTFIGKAIPPHS